MGARKRNRSSTVKNSRPVSSLPRPTSFFSSRRRHTRCHGDWSSDVCSSDLGSQPYGEILEREATPQDIESPSAACKMSAEAILQAYQRKHHFPLLILRLVNQVGARMRRGVIADFVSMAKTPWCEACGCYVQHPRLNSHFVHCCDRCLRPLRL